MPGSVLVTGASGGVGAEVVRRLRERGEAVRAAVRHPAGAGDRAGAPLPGDPGAGAGAPPGAGAEAVRFDFRDRGTFGPAFQGVDRLFLIRPPGLTNVRRHITPCLRFARWAGVEHVVFLSSLGAERNPLAPDRRTENAVRATGLPYTFLRPNLLMQHLSTTHRADIRERGEIFIPAGRGRASFVDARDVAAVAVRALAEAGHRQRTYPLTGGEALDYYAVARMSTEVLQRPVFYRAPATARFAAVELRRGRSPACVAALVVVYTAVRLGLAATVTGDTAGILGRAPTTVQRFFEDYRAVWL